MRVKRLLHFLTLMFCMSVFFIPQAVFASTGEMPENLKVDAIWADGELLQIDVTNLHTGEKQKLELLLKDYTDNSEYVSIQALDLDGNRSNIVQIKNPYYIATEDSKPQEKEEIAKDTTDDKTETAIPSGAVPFTPSGTGEVMDNATGNDGKEFFTIKTENDNVFHLIIDRQRSSDNVYLLNSVTEADLMALAEKGDGNGMSSIPTATPEPTPTPEPELPEKEEIAPPKKNGSTGTIIFIFMAVIIVGGIGYYFKIYKPRKNNMDIDDETEEIDEYIDLDTNYEDETDSDDENFEEDYE